jgi:hypothetical protein
VIAFAGFHSLVFRAVVNVLIRSSVFDPFVLENMKDFYFGQRFLFTVHDCKQLPVRFLLRLRGEQARFVNSLRQKPGLDSFWIRTLLPSPLDLGVDLIEIQRQRLSITLLVVTRYQLLPPRTNCECRCLRSSFARNRGNGSNGEHNAELGTTFLGLNRCAVCSGSRFR